MKQAKTKTNEEFPRRRDIENLGAIIGRNVRLARARRKITQENLVHAVHNQGLSITVKTLVRLELGQTRTPNPEMIYNIALALNCSWKSLLKKE